jgi:hypothetical protein
MKQLLPVAAALGFLASFGVASAQDAVVIQPEQRTVIREYVTENPIASINILGLEIGVGSKVPETVVLHEIPNTDYRYVVIDNRTVVVDPHTHQIVEVLN